MRQSLFPKSMSLLAGYDLATGRADLLAGFSVAMVAIPLSIAIAIASGVTPAQGLVTAIVGGFLISALGGSRVQIGGPTGAFIVVVAGVVAAHGVPGLVTATLMAGMILVGAGLLRLGSLVRFVPEAVINGFTIGIGAIIAASQLRDALGLTLVHEPAAFLEKLPALWEARGSLSPGALGVTVVTMVAIVVLRARFPRWPGLIVAVALGSALATLWPGIATVEARYGALPTGLPAPHLPVLDAARLWALFPSALVIAFLAGVESLLSAAVADRMVPGARHRPDAEVLAQGIANIGSALFGGIPATGAIARTATNVRAGGRTPVAGMVHAGAILLAVLVAAPLVGKMALPALAGLLLLTAWTMAEPQHWRGYLTKGAIGDRLLVALTFLLTLLVDLTIAIAVGVVLGALLRRLGLR